MSFNHACKLQYLLMELWSNLAEAAAAAEAEAEAFFFPQGSFIIAF
jgi:hypothetical protein